MDYKDLPVYQKARLLVKGVDALIKKFPNTPQAWTISRQLFGSATSIGANIAEGRGRHVGKEYEQFLYYAQGSCNETDHWLNTCKDCQLGSESELNALINLNIEVRKLLAATLNSLQRNMAQSGHKNLKEEGLEYLINENDSSTEF